MLKNRRKTQKLDQCGLLHFSNFAPFARIPETDPHFAVLMPDNRVLSTRVIKNV